MANPNNLNFALTFGKPIVSALGGEFSAEKARFFQAWGIAEGTAAINNPFATTKGGYPGEFLLPGNSAKVKQFPTTKIGIQATVDTIDNGLYDNLVTLLRDPNATAVQLGKAVANSPWGTGTGVLRVLGASTADLDEAVNASQANRSALQSVYTEQTAQHIQDQTVAQIQLSTLPQVQGFQPEALTPPSVAPSTPPDASAAIAAGAFEPSSSYLRLLGQQGKLGETLANIAQDVQSNIQADLMPDVDRSEESGMKGEVLNPDLLPVTPTVVPPPVEPDSGQVLPTGFVDPNAGLADPSAGLADPNVGFADLGDSPTVGDPGGGWQGTYNLATRLAKFGKDAGLTVWSEKRKTMATKSGGRSDHWTGSEDSYAYDLSNGDAPTAEMDQTAQQIVRSLGGTYDGTSELVFNKTIGNYRYQVIYRSNVGGNHYNHVHLGVRRVGGTV